MFCFKQWLLSLVTLYFTFIASATQDRFIVLTAAQDSEERCDDYNCKDYLGASINGLNDISFNPFLKDVNGEQKFRLDYLIDVERGIRYHMDLNERKLLVLISSYAKLGRFEREFECKSISECNEDERDYIYESRTRDVETIFRISPFKKVYFSYPFTLRTHLIQRGFLVASDDIINAFDVLSKEIFQESVSRSLLAIPEQGMTTSIVGVYDKQTGRIFVYDFENEATYALLALGIVNERSEYGYISVGMYGIPKYNCWCACYPNTHEPSVQEKAEQIVIDFFHSFSLKKNTTSDSQ